MNERAWTTHRPVISVAVLLWVFGSVAGLAWAFEYFGRPWPVYPLLVLFIAARQHTLYTVNHEASHGSLFRGARANKWAATVFCTWPFFHHVEAFSYVLWRRVHVLHHARLFTDGDPNFIGRMDQGDTARPMTRGHLLRHLFRSPWDAVRNFFFGKQDYAPPGPVKTWEKIRIPHLALLLKSFPHDRELENERRGKLLFIMAAIVTLTLTQTWDYALLYWFIPMYTVYPVILRLMDLTEHNWDATTGRLEDQANSGDTGVLGRLFISDLGRFIHFEHHENPAVPWFRLPAYRRHLRSKNKNAPPLRRHWRI